MYTTEFREKVVEHYRSDQSVGAPELSKLYGVSSASIIRWVVAAGVRRRPRGKQFRTEPTLRQQAILRMAQVMTYEHVGEQLGITKQAVHRLCRRWAGWMARQEPPFKIGDVVIKDGQRFQVVEAGLGSGTVVDTRGAYIYNFPWAVKGRLLYKEGSRPSK